MPERQPPAPEAATPEKIQAVEVVLTADCNLRCAYCYQNAKRPRSLSWDTLRGALDLLLRSRCPEVEVLFLGGEPLLQFPLICKAAAYVEATRPRNKAVCYTLITNGLLLGEEQACFLARHRIDVQLSFDGVPTAQDLRAPGTFEALDRLLERLRLHQPPLFHERLSVSLTLTSAAIPHLADSIAYFLAKGVPDISITPIVTHDPGWTNDRIEALDRQFARIFEACRQHHRRTGEIPLLLFRPAGEAKRGRPEDVMCRAPTGETLAIDVDGQVHGCAVFVESYQKPASGLFGECVSAIRLGDFRAPDFAERLARYPRAARDTRIFHEKRAKYSSFGRCAECRFVDACSFCPASIGHIPGNTDSRRVPDFQCAFNRVSLDYRQRFAARDLAAARRDERPIP
jgi:sulfatase maturation enzyme AslB (radical SAM superfamily)